MTLQEERYRVASRNVGRRCAWLDEDYAKAGKGVIAGLCFRGGWVWYRVRWDEDAPGWWTSEVSSVPSPTFVIYDEAEA